MKNLFVKEKHTAATITFIAIGAIAAGTIAYLYATKKDFAFRKKLADTGKKVKENATEYLSKKAHKLKKKTTDIHDIENLVKG